MSRPFHNKKRRGYRSNGYIRPSSGFSKFSDSTDVFAYDASMESSDICSNEHWGNNATLVEGPFFSWDLRTYSNEWELSDGKLNRAERRYIRRQAGCIVHQDSQGFISVNWYESTEKLESDWELVQAEYYPDDDESSESEG